MPMFARVEMFRSRPGAEIMLTVKLWETGPAPSRSTPLTVICAVPIWWPVTTRCLSLTLTVATFVSLLEAV